MIGDAHASFRATRRFGSLDGLRCLAIVPVVWHHATPRPLEGVLGRGPLGVDLFFVISGFLITTLLLRERDERGRIDLRGFYVRRVHRIFPLYFAVLGLFVVRALLRPSGDPIRAHFFESLPAYATFTATWLVRFDVPHPIAFGFAWSLSTEEQFYAMWPSLVALAGAVGARAGRHRAAVAALVPAASAVALVALDLHVESGGLAVLPEGSFGRRVIASIATPIALGALGAIATHARRSFVLVHAVLGARAAAPIALAVVVVCVVAPAPVLPTHLAMTALVLTATLREDNGLAGAWKLRPLARIGVVSYGIYLLHVSVLVAVRWAVPATTPTVVVFGAALAVTWAVAEASFRWFEGPFLRAGRRVTPDGSALGVARFVRPS